MSLAGLAIGLPVSGKEYIPTKGGDGKAQRPRFVLGKGTGIDLSISYDSFFAGGGATNLIKN